MGAQEIELQGVVAGRRRPGGWFGIDAVLAVAAGGVGLNRYAPDALEPLARAV